MLRRPEGATVDEVASATGWQRHTVRGVFSGTLKKKLGLTLAPAKEERGQVYRIAGKGMRAAIRDATARRHSGEPLSVIGQGSCSQKLEGQCRAAATTALMTARSIRRVVLRITIINSVISKYSEF